MSKRRAKKSQPGRCCRDIADVLEPRFFKALCDPSRVAILVRLARLGRPCTVSEIASCCPVDISVVSRHLALLRDAGILEARRTGKEVRYCVRFGSFVPTLRAMADTIESCCPSAPNSTKESRS
jgi:DNA-binding transcriptional ArsR family regulator